jgi:HEAT repeat protein
MKKTKVMSVYFMVYTIVCYSIMVSLFLTTPTFANDCTKLHDKCKKYEGYKCELSNTFTDEIVEERRHVKAGDKYLYVEEMPNGGRMRCRFTKDQSLEVARYYSLLAAAKTKRFNVRVSMPDGKIKTVDIFDGKEVENPLQKSLDNGKCRIFGYSSVSKATGQQIGGLSSVSLKQQIERLSSPAPVERGLAVVLLGREGARTASAVPALIKLLSDKTNLLEEEGPLDGLWPVYYGGIEKEAQWPPTIKSAAAWALIQIGKPAVEFLIAALKDENWHIQIYAAEILGNTRDTRAVEPLIAVLKDENWLVQEYAIRALRKITGEIGIKLERGAPAVETLIAALEDKDEDLGIRSEAAKALGKIKNASAVEPLIAILNDQNMSFSLREDIVEALGEIKDKRAVNPLIAALKDFFTKDEAAEALKKITGMNFGKDEIKWQQWWKQKRRHEKV